MGTELLLTGLLILLVLGLLVAWVYSMARLFGHARTQDMQGQKHFLAASILNFIVQK